MTKSWRPKESLSGQRPRMRHPLSREGEEIVIGLVNNMPGAAFHLAERQFCDLLTEAADGWRYSLWGTNRVAATKGWLGQNAYIDAAHRVHARVEDWIRTGKDAGLAHFHDFAVNAAWLTTAVIVSPTLSEPSIATRDGSVTSML